MSNYSDLERARRGTIRWRILFALNVVPSRPLGETLLLSVLHDAKLPLTGQELRDNLEYLQSKGLVELIDDFRSDCAVKLTGEGQDVAQYEVPCPTGIDRPLLN